MWGPFPRWLVVGFVVFIAAIEFAFRIPDIVLIGERYEAQKAEYQAKVLQSTTLLAAQMSKADADAERAKYDATTAKFSAEAAELQPRLLSAQLAKASADAITANYASLAAKYQPDLVEAQTLKAQNEGAASKLQPETVRQQLEKLRYDVRTASLQPDLTGAQLTKATFDAKAAAYQPDLVAAQTDKAKQEAVASIYQPKLNEIQVAKLAIDTRAAAAALPAAEQGGALSNVIMSVINGAVGIRPLNQSPEPAVSQPVSARPAAPVTPPPPPKRDVVGEKLMELVRMGNEILNRGDCDLSRVFDQMRPLTKGSDTAWQNTPVKASVQALLVRRSECVMAKERR